MCMKIFFKSAKLLMLSTLFVVPGLYADNQQYIEENYSIHKGDTLSNVLYNKGVHEASLLYGFEGNKSWVSENKEINPQIKNWDKLEPGDVIKIKYPSSIDNSSSNDVEELYVVKKGDTLSEILYSKGTTGIKTLYSKNGYVEKNEKLNPQISKWEKLEKGTTIKIVYKKNLNANTTVPEIKEAVVKAPVKEVKAKPADKNQDSDLEKIIDTIDSEKDSAAPAEAKAEENSSDYFLEHRFLLGMGLGFNKETQVTQTINTKAAVTFPILQYQMFYRPSSNLDAASWEYRFLLEINKGLATKGVGLPFGGKVEIDFGRYSLFKFGTTRFSPNINLIFDADSSITADVSSTLLARERRTLWLGFKPELVSYIGSTMIEYYPFVYKSLYMKSMSDSFSGWKVGLKTNVGLAYNNSLFGSFEYNYERHGNQLPTVVLSMHNILLGLGYRF